MQVIVNNMHIGEEGEETAPIPASHPVEILKKVLNSFGYDFKWTALTQRWDAKLSNNLESAMARRADHKKQTVVTSYFKS